MAYALRRGDSYASTPLSPPHLGLLVFTTVKVVIAQILSTKILPDFKKKFLLSPESCHSGSGFSGPVAPKFYKFVGLHSGGTPKQKWDFQVTDRVLRSLEQSKENALYKYSCS